MWLQTLIYITTFLITIFTIIYSYFKYKYATWDKENIPYLKPEFAFGNSKSFALLRNSLGDNFQQSYIDFKKKTSLFGGFYLFAKAEIMLLDPDLIKTILTKDFSHFVDRGGFVDEETDPLNANLVFLRGHKWKTSRTKITPTFTSGKMKIMFHTMLETSKELGNILDAYKNQPIDIKDIFARQATDVIGSCAFGLDCDSLKNPDTEFRQFGKKAFQFGFKAAIINALATNFPMELKVFKIPQIDADVSNFFINVLRQTVDYREKNNVQRKDFLDLLIRLKNKQSVLNELMETTMEEEGISFNDLAANCFVFFVAGFETISSTLNFYLFELCNNQEIQETARKEILSMLKNHDGAVTYEGIMEMKYINKIFQEVLRKYPSIPILTRECTQDFKVSDTDFVIKKGVEVVVSTLGLQRDPEFYPDRDRFDPERFSEEEKSKRHPYTNLPFGEGPRNCIGMRFALLPVKIVLSVLLRDFKFKLDPKTSVSIVFDPKSIFLSPKDTVWLQAERIKD